MGMNGYEWGYSRGFLIVLCLFPCYNGHTHERIRAVVACTLTVVMPVLLSYRKGDRSKIQLEGGEHYVGFRDCNGNSGNCTVVGTTY